MKTLFLVLLLIFCLLLSSCSSSQIVATLEAVVSAAEIAIPVIGSAAGLSPQTQTMIVTYLQAVNRATGQASTILSGPGTSAEKAVAIASLFAGVAKGLNLPPGTPTQIINVIQGVANAVMAFLQNFPQSNALKAAAPVSMKVSRSDKAKLQSLLSRSNASLKKLAVMKK